MVDRSGYLGFPGHGGTLAHDIGEVVGQLVVQALLQMVLLVVG